MSQASTATIEAWLGPLADLIGPVYPWLNGLHVLTIGLLVGAVTLLDLRLLGIFRGVAVSQLAVPAIRVAACGLGGSRADRHPVVQRAARPLPGQQRVSRQAGDHSGWADKPDPAACPARLAASAA